MDALVVSKLTKKHGSHVAVNGLSLAVRSGEILSVLGPSGCGKTTLLRCVAGLEEISSGAISISGRVVATPTMSVPPERRNIGLVFQSYALWPHLTVFDNIALGLKIRRISKGDIRIKVDDTLRKLELSDLVKRYPSQLSGGQQQRVAVARAIVLEPEILLFDEPLSNLDARIRERVRGELHDLLRKLAVTTLYVTHDKTEAMAISDRIVVMRNGAIEQVGDSQEIYERPASTFVAEFIGRYNLIPVRPWSPESGNASLMAGRRRLSIASETEEGVGVVGFCPEVVQFGSSDQTENMFVAHLEKQTYFGNTIEIIGRIGGSTITVNAVRPVAGETFSFHVPPDQLLFFGSSREVGSESEADINPLASD